MKRALILFGALVLLALPAAADDSANQSGCRGVDIDTDDTDVYLAAAHGGDVTLFSNGETVSVTLYTCQKSNDTTTCDVYLWDHDGNGTATQGSLDGSGATLTRGTAVPAVPMIRAEVTVAPSTDSTAILLLCEQ